eukprot:COSAG02_NODE_3379_length_6839_cov_2.979970_2_plen_152_part_00
MLTQTHIFSANGTHVTYTLQYIPILAFSECAFVRKFQCQTANTKQETHTGPGESSESYCTAVLALGTCGRSRAGAALSAGVGRNGGARAAADDRSRLAIVPRGWFEVSASVRIRMLPFDNSLPSVPGSVVQAARPGPTVSVFFGVLNVLHC